MAEYTTARTGEQLRAAGLHVIELPTLSLSNIGEGPRPGQLADKLEKTLTHQMKGAARFLEGIIYLIICLGPGGVGKTTISAALALMARWTGGSVDVMTVDPAPRLLDALGLDAPERGAAGGPAAGSPREPRSARACARSNSIPKRPSMRWWIATRPRPPRATRSSQNRIYRNLSDALSGVGDYMAMEKLLELYSRPTGSRRPRYAARARGDRFPRRATPPARSAQLARDYPAGPSGGNLLRGLKMVDFAARHRAERLRSRDRAASAWRCAGIRRSFSGNVCGIRRAGAEGRRAAAFR